jgi:TonB family protein
MRAAVGLAFSPVGRLTEEPIAEVEFAGREGVVIIEASFAAAATPADPVVEIPRAEAPIEVTPQEARIEHRLYRQAPSQAIDFESPPVELSDFGETPPPAIRPAEIAADWQPAAVRPLAASLSKAAAEPPAVALSPPSSAAPMTAGFETPASFAGNAPPVYPAMAVNNRWSGSVLLKLWIDEAGAVTDVRIERSSGHGVLDAAAVNAVRHWRGKPKRVDGRGVATIELQEIKFRLPR